MLTNVEKNGTEKNDRESEKKRASAIVQPTKQKQNMHQLLAFQVLNKQTDLGEIHTN